MLVKKNKNKPFYPQQPVLVCSTPCFVAVFHSDLEYIFLSKCGNLNKKFIVFFHQNKHCSFKLYCTSKCKCL